MANTPLETIAKHPSEVIYRFTELNPKAEYEIRAEFYNQAGTYLKQRITADGSLIAADFDLPAGQNRSRLVRASEGNLF